MVKINTVYYVMLISLIILSLKKENYKSLMKMMILFYIITGIIIYDGIIIKDMTISNYNLKFYKVSYIKSCWFCLSNFLELNTWIDFEEFKKSLLIIINEKINQNNKKFYVEVFDKV